METSGKMSTTRLIQVYDTRTQKMVNIETSSNQWSDLIPLIEKEGINLNNTKAVLGSTKGTLELPNALIPEGNQQILLAPLKMKSGAPSVLVSIGYNELRRKAKSLGIEGLGSNPSKDLLIKSIEEKEGLNVKATTKVDKIVLATKKETIVKEIKESTPNLEERVSFLEESLGKLINGIHKVTSEFIAPKEEIVVEKEVVKSTNTSTNVMSKEDLRKMAESLNFNSSSVAEDENDDESEDDEDDENED